jgi:hypothetical protein
MLWSTLQQVTGAGLFDEDVNDEGRPPFWKVDAFHAVLAGFGFTHRYWSKHIQRRHGNGVQWGAPAIAPAPIAAVGPAAPGDCLELHTGLSPSDWLRPLAVDMLLPEEVAIHDWIIGNNRRGKSPIFTHYVKYKKENNFGRPGAASPQSRGYTSPTVLARVIWLWAGADWPRRVW